jgi:gamma-glutamyltranspeptidase
LKEKYRLISSLRNSWYTGRIIQVQKYGSLPIAEILAPVIALAENGVVVTEFQAQSLANYRETFIKLMVPTACFLKYTRQVIRLSIRH